MATSRSSRSSSKGEVVKEILGGAGLGTLMIFIGMAVAQPKDPHGSPPAHAQPYAGQQNRAITSFSDKELSDIREGRGMGLARPAELNGYPGPMHVLELAGELQLTDEQRMAVEAIFAHMKQSAQVAGDRYLEAEQAVDAAFRSGNATPDRISALVRQADGARAEVRLAHLNAHLATAPLLSGEQRRRYAELRGYSGSSDDDGHQHRHREQAK